MKKKIVHFLGLLCLLSTTFCFASAQNASFGMDGQGNAWTVLVENEAIPYPVVKAIYKPYGLSLGTPVTISDPDFESELPKIAVNVYGDGVIVWAAYDTVNGIKSLFISTLKAGQSWTSPARLSQYDENIYNDYQLEIMDDGKIVVSWGSSLLEYGPAFNITAGDTDGNWDTPSRYPNL